MLKILFRRKKKKFSSFFDARIQSVYALNYSENFHDPRTNRNAWAMFSFFLFKKQNKVEHEWKVPKRMGSFTHLFDANW